MIAYHFTSRFYLPAILREGVRKGDVSTSSKKGFNAPMLTVDLDWEQDWALAARNYTVLNKTEVRLTVRIPEDNRAQVLTWEDVVKKYKVDKFWDEAQHFNVDPSRFLFYMGVILPEWIQKVDLRPDLEEFEWEALVDSESQKPYKFQYYMNSPKIGRESEVRLRDYAVSDITKGLGHWPIPGYIYERGKAPSYPWSDMPRWMIRSIADCHPDRAVETLTLMCKNAGLHHCWPAAQEKISGFDFAALSRWFHSPQKLIQLSKPAVDLLDQAEPRFHALPEFGDKPWRKGAVFSFPGHGHPMFVYAEPYRDGDGDPGILYVAWHKDHVGSWCPIVPMQRPDDLEDWMETGDSRKLYVPESRTMVWTHRQHLIEREGSNINLIIAHDGTRLDMGKILRVAVNALAALHEDPKLIVGKRQKGQKRARREKTSGMKRITLDVDGMRIITRRWIIEDNQEGQEGPQFRMGDRKKPGIHTVQPHEFHVWVRAPKPDEKSVATKVKTDRRGKQITYFKVKRWRGREGAYSRGEGVVSPTPSKMVTGIDDL
jgi:hypothetical protein